MLDFKEKGFEKIEVDRLFQIRLLTVCVYSMCSFCKSIVCFDKININ
ncbi:MAG: hypothetical protein ACI8YQ_000180 [Polaribacter sp.]|jgi:hypothetical protein